MPEHLLITGGRVHYSKEGLAKVFDNNGRTILEENADGTTVKYDYSSKPEISNKYDKSGKLLETVQYYKDGYTTITYDEKGQSDLTIHKDSYGRPTKIVLGKSTSKFDIPETMIPNSMITLLYADNSIFKILKYDINGKLIKEDK